MTQTGDGLYEDYYHTSTNTLEQEEFVKWQQQEIYQRNNPDKLPELGPLASGQDARGVVRKSESNNESTSNSMKRQR